MNTLAAYTQPKVHPHSLSTGLPKWQSGPQRRNFATRGAAAHHGALETVMQLAKLSLAPGQHLVQPPLVRVQRLDLRTHHSPNYSFKQSGRAI